MGESEKARKRRVKPPRSPQEVAAQAVAETQASHVPPHPYATTWEIKRINGPEGEPLLVCIFFTHLGPIHIFFAPDNAKEIAEVLTREATNADLHVVGTRLIVPNGAS